MQAKLLVSLVIPCHNEEEVLEELFGRITRVAAAREDVEFEFLFVDDGSADHTLSILRRLSEEDSRVRIISFSRNFGHQLAVTAGIDKAKGDAVVLLDADLQDPPELIPAFLDAWRLGYQVVYGKRLTRAGESSFKRLTAKIFYRLLNTLSDIPIPLDTGDFRLMDRAVCNTLRRMPERDRFVRGLVSWIGFRQRAIEYNRDPRFSGHTKYPLRKMLRFASDGILSFSVRPLRLATMLGVMSASLACIGIVWISVSRLVYDNLVPGWAATIVAVLFFGGVQLFCTGILGEYIGRIFMQSKERPLYVIAEEIQRDI